MGQVNTGELRLKVTDSTGAGVQASVTVLSQGNQYRTVLTTDAEGSAAIHRLPYGVYLITVERQGFSPVSNTLQIGSALPIKSVIKLQVAPVNTVVSVNAEETLIDPDRPSSIMQIGSKQIQDRVQSLPRPIGARPGESRNRAGSTKAMPCCIRGARNTRPSS